MQENQKGIFETEELVPWDSLRALKEIGLLEPHLTVGQGAISSKE